MACKCVLCVVWFDGGLLNLVGSDATAITHATENGVLAVEQIQWRVKFL